MPNFSAVLLIGAFTSMTSGHWCVDDSGMPAIQIQILAQLLNLLERVLLSEYQS